MPDTLKNGLIGWWTFDGNDINWTSDTAGTALDKSGNGHHGTLTNMNRKLVCVPGKIGQALKLNGSSNYSTSTLTAALTSLPVNGMSISGWIKYERPYVINDTPKDVIIGTYNEQGFIPYGWRVYVTHETFNQPYLRFESVHSTTSHEVYSDATTISIGKWHHFCITGNSTNDSGTIYIDGKSVTANITNHSGTYSVDSGGDSDGLRIGANYYRVIRDFFYGHLDDIRVYNRALSAAEISQLYTQSQSKLISLSRQNTSIDLQKGLVGWWTFDGKDTNWTSDTTGTTLDKSGNGNHGTLTNMNRKFSCVPGKIGQALKFDGVDDNVSIGNYSFNFINPYTISLWFKYNSSTHIGTIFGKPYYEYNFSINNNGLRWRQQSTGGSAQISLLSGAILQPGKWYHGIITFDGTVAILYVDAISRATDSVFSGIGRETANLTTIGTGWEDTQSVGLYYFDGYIDDVRIYNRALSAAEVQALYNLSRPKILSLPKRHTKSTLSDGLIGWWGFDGNTMNWTSDTAGTVLDKSGQGNHGTLTNMDRKLACVPGKVGQALKFDGVDDYISTGIIQPFTPITLTAWINTTNSAIQFINSNDNSGGSSGRAWQFRLDADGILRAIFFSSGSTNAQAFGTIDLRGKGWKHVAATWDGSNIKVFVDGVQDGSTVAFSGVPSNIPNIAAYIGNGTGTGGSAPFLGKIDDVRIYNRALSPSEVSELYNLSLPKIKSM